MRHIGTVRTLTARANGHSPHAHQLVALRLIKPIPGLEHPSGLDGLCRGAARGAVGTGVKSLPTRCGVPAIEQPAS
jgi:hypothetical protein